MDQFYCFNGDFSFFRDSDRMPSLMIEIDSKKDMVYYKVNVNRVKQKQPNQEQYCDVNTTCESGEC